MVAGNSPYCNTEDLWRNPWNRNSICFHSVAISVNQQVRLQKISKGKYSNPAVFDKSKNIVYGYMVVKKGIHMDLESRKHSKGCGTNRYGRRVVSLIEFFRKLRKNAMHCKCYNYVCPYWSLCKFREVPPIPVDAYVRGLLDISEVMTRICDTGPWWANNSA